MALVEEGGDEEHQFQQEEEDYYNENQSYYDQQEQVAQPQLIEVVSETQTENSFNEEMGEDEIVE